MSRLFLIMVITALSLHGFAPVKVYVYCSPNEEKYEILSQAMRKEGIDLERVEKLDKEDEHLHIIFDAFHIPFQYFPKNYLLFQTLNLDEVPLTRSYSEKLSHAIAIWDPSWRNIGKYSLLHENYLHFSRDLLDILLLPCLVPIEKLKKYKEVLTYSNRNDTDISSHLPTLFAHCAIHKPALVIEAGVRAGESSYAFHSALLGSRAKMVGIDIDSRSENVYQQIEHSEFIRLDDSQIGSWWVQSKMKESKADLIFIDTSHFYDHTLKELETFLPLLNSGGWLIFHDTYMCPLPNHLYQRLNHTYGTGGNWESGVARAIEDFFSIHFDQEKPSEMNFLWDQQLCLLRHYPYCNGLTLIKIGKEIE